MTPIPKSNTHGRCQRNAQLNYCEAVDLFYKWRLAPNSHAFFAQLKTLVSNKNLIRCKSTVKCSETPIVPYFIWGWGAGGERERRIRGIATHDDGGHWEALHLQSGKAWEEREPMVYIPVWVQEDVMFQLKLRSRGKRSELFFPLPVLFQASKD